jgi:transglutaminase-like putative cysteine protease
MGAVALAQELLLYTRGWLGPALALAATLLVPASLSAGGWLPLVGRLLPCAAAGFAAGLFAAGRRRRWWVAAGACGGGVAFLVATAVYARSAPWWHGLAEAGQRFWWWCSVLWLGGATDDPLVPALFVGWAVFLCGLCAAWGATPHGEPLLGSLPAGVVIALSAFFSAAGRSQLLCFVAVCLLLLAERTISSAELAVGGDSSEPDEGVRPVSLGASIAIIAVALVFGIALPGFGSSRISAAFWSVAREPWERFVQLAHWWFPALRARGPAWPGASGAPSAVMPAARSLGGEVRPQDTVVMQVWTDEPPPVAAGPHGFEDVPSVSRYLRGMTYDLYTGRGWANSALDTKQLRSGESIQPLSPGRKATLQRIQILVPRDELLYAIPEPARFGVNVRARYRGPDDLAFVRGSLASYEVLSLTASPTVQELRLAGPEVPSAIRSRYLQLPPVPERVRALAMELTAGLDTAYDKAVAIEGFLRSFQYDTEVPEPAEGKDVVDYFLFELKRGYCDYYASAMVVLARLAGLPARMASGYVLSEYDYAAGLYLVRERHAHSWPELYFRGHGWVAFEPTAVRPRLYRPNGAPAPAISDSIHRASPPPDRGVTLAQLGLFVALSVLAAGVALATAWIAQHPAAARAYALLELAGLIAGCRPRPSQTVREFAASLARALSPGAEHAGNDRQPVPVLILAVATSYEIGRYGPPHGQSGAGGQLPLPVFVRAIRARASALTARARPRPGSRSCSKAQTD